MVQPYFINPLVSLYYNRADGLGIAVWNGQVQGADFKEAVLLCLELMNRFELRAWLSDNRKVQGVNIADLQWSIKTVSLRIVGLPLLRLARLPSETEIISTTVNSMLKDSIHKLKVDTRHPLLRDFENEEAAMAWLTATDTST